MSSSIRPVNVARTRGIPAHPFAVCIQYTGQVTQASRCSWIPCRPKQSRPPCYASEALCSENRHPMLDAPPPYHLQLPHSLRLTHMLSLNVQPTIGIPTTTHCRTNIPPPPRDFDSQHRHCRSPSSAFYCARATHRQLLNSLAQGEPIRASVQHVVLLRATVPLGSHHSGYSDLWRGQRRGNLGRSRNRGTSGLGGAGGACSRLQHAVRQSFPIHEVSVQNDKSNYQHACEQSITRAHTCLPADRGVPSLRAEVGWALQVREHNNRTCT